ncbi:MAG TPA: hypothetical protein PLO89_09305 [Spirochaetota bacterium]|nr:hypothetical protein [Spirochaetota bacterium]
MKKVCFLIFVSFSLFFLNPQQKGRVVLSKIVDVESEIISIEKDLETIQDAAKLKQYFDLILPQSDYKDIKSREDLQKLLQDRGIIFLNTGAKFVFKEDNPVYEIQIIVNKYSLEGWEFHLMTETKKGLFLTFKK